HRLDDAFYDHGRSQPGPQTEKQHLAAVVAAQRLHGGVVDDFDGAAEGSAEIEPDPAAPEIVRFRHRPPADHPAGVADRGGIEFAAFRQLLDGIDHAPGSHRAAGRNFSTLVLAGRQNLDIGSADVNYQNRSRHRGALLRPSASSRVDRLDLKLRVAEMAMQE